MMLSLARNSHFTVPNCLRAAEATNDKRRIGEEMQASL